MSVGNLEEIIDDNHAIVSTSVGSEHYVSILSFVDKDQLEPGCSVLLNHKVLYIIKHPLLCECCCSFFLPSHSFLSLHLLCGGVDLLFLLSPPAVATCFCSHSETPTRIISKYLQYAYWHWGICLVNFFFAFFSFFNKF